MPPSSKLQERLFIPLSTYPASMQKLARTARAISAHRHAEQQAKKFAAKKARRKVIADNSEQSRERNSLIRAARVARREDWQLGLLAPRRDVGEGAETYGTVGKKLVEGVKKRRPDKKDWGIRTGDRVVVTGTWEREKGRIGEVAEVKSEKGEVVVKGLNLVCYW
jgi:large subunit ribosomal protein L24